MKTKNGNRNAGYALMITLFFSGISLMALGGALQWTSSTARMTERNNRYFAAAAAAEAATEKALSSISYDYQIAGEVNVFNRLDRYRAAVPTVADDAYWGGFIFSDAQGNDNRTFIERSRAWGYTLMDSQYKGLYGMAASYKIVSNARDLGVNPPIVAGVKQEIQVAAIPMFQFAIFYTMDLEINPAPTMNITGRVHSNANLYNDAAGQVTYQSDVTAAGQIVFKKAPLDPTARTSRKPIFQAEHEANATALTLPIGTNNTPEAVRAVVEIPPVGESANSAMGMQRYYNKSDIVIVVDKNSKVTARTGNWDSFNNTLDVSSFVTLTTNAFLDKREGVKMSTTEVDVGKMMEWNAKQADLNGKLGREINTIYVADLRYTNTAGSTKSAVRIKNGRTLPNAGLTISTPNPAYVQGHYNAPVSDLGTTNTLRTKPASIVADAISIQSTNWKDANSEKDSGSRAAGDTTINAAFLGGIVPSNGSNYSGGVENFPRFLEGWSGRTLTYNGSMVVMFPSKYAKGVWGSSDVYVPPNRNWTFDLNFMDPMKLPPGTPMFVVTYRGKWAMVPANSVL